MTTVTVSLSDEEMRRLEELSKREKMIGSLFKIGQRGQRRCILN